MSRLIYRLFTWFEISLCSALGVEVLEGKIRTSKLVPILGLHEQRSEPLAGRIAVYGDSNCLDSSHLTKDCFWLIDALLEFTMHQRVGYI